MTTSLPKPIETEHAPRPFHWTVEAYHRAWDSGVFGHDAKLELVFGRIIERFAEGGPADYHWTADDFERACEANVFGWDARLELIHGKVIDRMAESVLHGFVVTLIVEYLRSLLPQGFLVRADRLIRIAFDGDPVPDITVVYGGPFIYRNRHATPEDVALLMEVAVSSAENDTGDKALLYAQAGIKDYWVALPETQTLMVHREPTAEGYQSIRTLTGDAIVLPLAAPAAPFTVSDLFGEDGVQST